MHMVPHMQTQTNVQGMLMEVVSITATIPWAASPAHATLGLC